MSGSIVCAWLALAAATGPELPAAARPLPSDAPVRTHYLVPALETVGFQFGILAFNNLVTRQGFALVSWDTIQSHFDGRAGWTFDVDFFLTNQFAHPYQGSLSFAAARSSGVPFWGAAAYTFAGSLAWEYFFERDAPSINDQITTSVGGAFLGEALYRSYRYVVTRYRGAPNVWRDLGAILISPPSAANRWLFADGLRPPDLEDLPPLFAALSPGMSLQARFFDQTTPGSKPLFEEGPQAFVALKLIYGAPGDPDWGYRHPFSYFHLDASLALPGRPVASLYIDGLLAGGQYGARHTLMRGAWGLFGVYDYGANNIVRVSGVGAGPGTVFQLGLQKGLALRASVVTALLGFAAAGNLGLDPLLARNYHIGPGLKGEVDLELVRQGVARVGFRVQHWSIDGFYVEPKNGFESITYTTAKLDLRAAENVAFRLELPIWTRYYGFDRERPEVIVGSGPRISVVVMSDDVFGVSLR